MSACLPVACRFMDEIVANPDLWVQRIRQTTNPDRETPIRS